MAPGSPGVTSALQDLRRFQLPIILLLLLLPLAACGLFTSKEIRTLRKSPDYRAGYQDGPGLRASLND